MVYVIDRADMIGQIEEIVYCSIDVFLNDMLWNKCIYIVSYCLFELFTFVIAYKLYKDRESDFLLYADILGIKVHIGFQVDHVVGENLRYRSVIRLYPSIGYPAILQLYGFLTGQHFSLFRQYFTSQRIDNDLCECLSRNPWSEGQFLVELVPSHIR